MAPGFDLIEATVAAWSDCAANAHSIRLQDLAAVLPDIAGRIPVGSGNAVQGKRRLTELFSNASTDSRIQVPFLRMVSVHDGQVHFVSFWHAFAQATCLVQGRNVHDEPQQHGLSGDLETLRRALLRLSAESAFAAQQDHRRRWALPLESLSEVMQKIQKESIGPRLWVDATQRLNQLKFKVAGEVSLEEITLWLVPWLKEIVNNTEVASEMETSAAQTRRVIARVATPARSMLKARQRKNEMVNEGASGAKAIHVVACERQPGPTPYQPGIENSPEIAQETARAALPPSVTGEGMTKKKVGVSFGGLLTNAGVTRRGLFSNERRARKSCPALVATRMPVGDSPAIFIPDIPSEYLGLDASAKSMEARAATAPVPNIEMPGIWARAATAPVPNIEMPDSPPPPEAPPVAPIQSRQNEMSIAEWVDSTPPRPPPPSRKHGDVHLTLKCGTVGRCSALSSPGPSPPASPQVAANAARLLKGTVVEYFSESNKRWIPAIVQGYDKATGTYKLDVKKIAMRNDIRAAPAQQAAARVVPRPCAVGPIAGDVTVKQGPAREWDLAGGNIDAQPVRGPTCRLLTMAASGECSQSVVTITGAAQPLNSHGEPLMPEKMDVLLHIYNVTKDDRIGTLNFLLANAMSPLKFGGAFHAGVEVGGLEWSYGQTHSDKPGVECVKPKTHPFHHYRQSVHLGKTQHSMDRVVSILADLVEEYPGHKYDMLRRNCCHFSDEFCQRLDVEPVPGWVHRFARVGAQADDLMQVIFGAPDHCVGPGSVTGEEWIEPDCPYLGNSLKEYLVS